MNSPNAVAGIATKEQAPGIKVLDPCPICESPFTAYVRHVLTRRTKQQIPLYICLDCLSFTNPSGYTETQEILAADLQWHISVSDRNKSAAKRLFDKLAEEGVKPRSVADIGCGIGSLLTVARDRGMRVVGFDTNAQSTEYGRTQMKLNLVGNYWTKDTDTGPIDLYLCISVCEHLEKPRPLIQDLCAAAARQRAALFVSVPFVDRAAWPFILDPDPYAKGTPFFDNDVHITHFSTKGLEKVMRDFGAPNFKFVQGGLWNGGLVKF
jgi:2-polyprenyl-3-methyl-5-hydroxy-6-metoxy-1,4-benzoquinol methylase